MIRSDRTDILHSALRQCDCSVLLELKEVDSF